MAIGTADSDDGKASRGYQLGAAQSELNGLAALIVDPIGQGERLQVRDQQGNVGVAATGQEHTLLGTAAIPIGWSTARWMIHDAMAAIDYLQSHRDIRGDRIGCMGNSGGGTQSAYLMALDEWIGAAANGETVLSVDIRGAGEMLPAGTRW